MTAGTNSPSEKSSLTFSTTVGQNNVSANLTNSLAPFRVFPGHGPVRSAPLAPSARLPAGETQKKPAQFGGTRLAAPERRTAGVGRRAAQLFLDAQELVVLGHPIGARRGAGLDLPRIAGHGQIGNGGVLCFP